MQWIFDIIVDRVKAELGIPPCFITRPDPFSWILDIGTIHDDGAWHDVDISSIVPANAQAVCINAKLLGVEQLSVIDFVPYNFDGPQYMQSISTHILDRENQGRVIIPLYYDKKFSYRVTPDTEVYASIFGWIL